MKRLHTPAHGQRFQAQLRHYHRTTQTASTWDAWVDSKETGSRRRTLIGAITLTFGGLAAIAIFVVMRTGGI